jgi:hypothetical protein
MATAIAPRTYADALVKQKVAVGGTKAARDAVVETIRELMVAATNKPATPDVAKTVPHSGAAANASADIKKLYGSQAAGSISVAILGEDHSSAKDTARAQAIIAEIGTGAIMPTILLFERYLRNSETNPTTKRVGPYPSPGAAYTGRIVSELDLTTGTAGFFGDGLDAEARSMVVAGYLVLCSAGGDQTSVDKCLLVFGENHADILEKFDNFSKLHTNWIQKRPRTLFLIDSFVKS